MKLVVPAADLKAIRSALVQAAVAAPVVPADYHSPRGWWLEVLDRIDAQTSKSAPALARLARLDAGEPHEAVYNFAYGDTYRPGSEAENGVQRPQAGRRHARPSHGSSTVRG